MPTTETKPVRRRGKGRSRLQVLDDAIGRLLLRILQVGVAARDPVGGGPLRDASGAQVYAQPGAAYIAVAIAYLRAHGFKASPARSGIAGAVAEALGRFTGASGDAEDK